VVYTGIPEVPEDSRSVKRDQEHLALNCDLLYLKSSATLVSAQSLAGLSLVGIPKTCVYFLWILSLNPYSYVMVYHTGTPLRDTASPLPGGSLVSIYHCIFVPSNALMYDLPLSHHSQVLR
jgi:hypothetical protein